MRCMISAMSGISPLPDAMLLKSSLSIADLAIWSIIGSMDELRASTSKDLQKFWETYYIPGNAALVVVGDIEHGAVQDLAKKYFGWISA